MVTLITLPMYFPGRFRLHKPHLNEFDNFRVFASTRVHHIAAHRRRETIFGAFSSRNVADAQADETRMQDLGPIL